MYGNGKEQSSKVRVISTYSGLLINNVTHRMMMTTTMTMTMRIVMKVFAQPSLLIISP